MTQQIAKTSITDNLLQAIVNYLDRQPHGEVHQLIAQIQFEYTENHKVVSEFSEPVNIK